MTHFWAILVLQYHLTRHVVTQGKLIMAFLMGVLLAGACAAAVFVGWMAFQMGASALADAPPGLVLLLANVVLLFHGTLWLMSILVEAQRKDAIDVRKLLYLPLSLHHLHAVNFAVSLVGLINLFCLMGAGGFIIGLACAGHPGAGALALGAALYLLGAGAWAHAFRGLVALGLVHPKLRGVMVTIVPLAAALGGFLPLFVSNAMQREFINEDRLNWALDPAQFRWVEHFSTATPMGWLALTLDASMSGIAPGLLPLAGLALFFLAGYWLSYRFTLRYCAMSTQGRERRKRPARRIPWTLRKLPVLNDETATLTIALFLSFVRHPNVRLTIAASPAFMLLIPLFSRFGGAMSGNTWPIFFMIWPLIAMYSVFTNVFGVDHRAFRTLMLLPVPRHRVLLAYHVALLFIAGGISLLTTAFATYYFALGPRVAVVVAMQTIQIFVLMTMTGTYFSLYGPSSLSRSVTQGARSSLALNLLMPLVFGLILLPSTLCLTLEGVFTRWLPASFPLGIALSLLFLVLTLASYPFVLRHAGDLLHLREQKILDALIRSAR